MTRRTVLAGCLATLAAPSTTLSLPLSGDGTGNRVVPGRGSFPRWQGVAMATADAPIRWLTAMPGRQLAAVDRDGSLWILSVSATAITVTGRYGEIAGPDSPPVVVVLDQDRSGIALVGRDGRLAVWSDGTMRSYDVGAPLSRLTAPSPVRLAGREWDDLLAVAADGAVLLLGNMPAAPRTLARVDARALPDARITLGDLDGDGLVEAVVLTEATDRYPHGALGDGLEAGAVTVLGLVPNGLAMRARLPVTAPAVYEDLVPVLAQVGSPRMSVLLAKSSPQDGTAIRLLGWRDGGLATLAESAGVGQGQRWSHVLGVVDLSGPGSAEIVGVRTPHAGGVLTAYRRRGTSLVPVAKAAGYASHAFGSRNLDQAVMADLDGNGRAEVVLPRQARDVLAGLELEGARFVERWSVTFKTPIESNVVVADLDGDGLLDLVVADRRGVYVFSSMR